jgi:mono/diheme cytochrome c family protein
MKRGFTMKQLIMHNMKKAIFVILIFYYTSAIVFAQQEKWIAPEAESKASNPVALTPRNVAVGKGVFMRICAPCHGLKADGKGLMESPNLLLDSFQMQSDGAIFYKISTGKNKMPPFKGNLKDEEMWNLVHYFRVLKNPTIIPPPKELTFQISTNKDQRSITATTLTKDSLNKQPIPEIDIHFYVKREFGLLPIGPPINNTDATGKVTIMFPEKIIGDMDGNVIIIAKVENNFMYMDTLAQVTEKWGIPLKTKDDLMHGRALWGSRAKSPVWLLFLANGILLAVWSVILYIVYNLFRINKAGKIFIK